MQELDVAKIRDFYDSDPQKEWDRHDLYPFEFPITCRHIDRYISKGNCSILDIGGGPGRYAFHLAKSGHKVALLDLSPGNIAYAKAKASELGISLSDYIVGNAVDLSGFSGDQFDLVLVLGPLYHLDNTDDRQSCIAEAVRVLKKGGVALFAFISTYAPIYYTLKNLPEREILSIARLKELFSEETLIQSKDDPWFTDAKYVNPTEAGSWVNSLGYKVISVFGAESLLPQSQYHIQGLGSRKIEEWTSFGYEMSETVGGVVGSEHLVVVVQK